VPTTKPRPDSTLVKALARAWRWQRMLEGGEYATLAELADAERTGGSLHLPRPADEAPRPRHRRTNPRRPADGSAGGVPEAVPGRVGDAATEILPGAMMKRWRWIQLAEGCGNRGEAAPGACSASPCRSSRLDPSGRRRRSPLTRLLSSRGGRVNQLGIAGEIWTTYDSSSYDLGR